ncbi:hypothetical protein BKA65DRAFT_414326 [Rhexocercosporidium sp. MPI-PUGE-AT-0058]|nr:hypothetical protein BKA65DRAFT_414326 [Rhexocercosporidium sp. MPI-PUGE-AT-0058]
MSQQQDHIRDSQRVPRSCTECSRRKIKCSKTVPCSACVRRGEPALCAREMVRVNGRITVSDRDENQPGEDVHAEQVAQLKRANAEMQARVELLEAAVLGGGHEHGHRQDGSSGATAPTSTCEISLSNENFLSTFQELESPSSKVASPSAPSLGRGVSRGTGYLFSILPNPASSEAIVRFSLENLGWVHCALNAPEFLAQHENFWTGVQAKDSQVLEDHGWIALYLSVISVGIYFFDRSDGFELHFLHEGVLWHGNSSSPLSDSASDFQAISRTWYEAVFEELNRVDFLGVPAVSTVQTVAILPLIHRNLGEVEREYNLLAVAINTAKALQMDLLGREDSQLPRSSSIRYWRERSNRELGRRLWWTLVICDWMMMPMRPCMIEPGSFTSTLSMESDTSHRNIIISSTPALAPNIDLPYFPEPLAYHIFVARIASIVRPYRDRSVKYSVPGACNTLQALESLAQALPPHLSLDKDPWFSKTSLFPWIEAQRSLVIMLLSVCRINVCLLGLLETLETGDDPFDFRGCGRRAALKIVSHLQEQPVRFFSKMWGQRSCIFSAGVYLALDLICFRRSMSGTDIESQLAAINFTRQRLQEIDSNANEGPEVLKRLLCLFHQWPVQQVVQRQTIIGILVCVADPAKDCIQEASASAPWGSAGWMSSTPDGTFGQQYQPSLSQQQVPVAVDMLGSELDLGLDRRLSGVGFNLLPNHLQLEGDWPADAFTDTLSWQQMF